MSEGASISAGACSPVAFGEARAALRSLLARSFHAARLYDGTDEGLALLVEQMDPLDVFLEAARANTTASRDEAERLLTRQARSKKGLRRAPMSVGDLLDLAYESYAKKLATKKIDLQMRPLPFVLIPPSSYEGPVLGGPNGVAYEVRTEDRLAEILLLLDRQGISRNDIALDESAVDPTSMRQSPYVLVSVPRLNREILVCAQVGEAIFVGRGLRGSLFWATQGKRVLYQREDVVRLVAHNGWIEHLKEALFHDNVSSAKMRVDRSTFPLSEELILIKALEYAVSHDGQLPTRYTGGVPGLPGENWANWGTQLRVRGRGLAREGLRGLAHLFRLYGLKTRRAENDAVVRQAWEAYQKTGRTQLVACDEDSLLMAAPLTEDLILSKAVAYAMRHDGKLPVSSSDEVEGMEGTTWHSIEHALRGSLRGLSRPGLRGLSHLFRLCGLKTGRTTNRARLEQAWEKYQKEGTTGLHVGEEDSILLTEELILGKALEYARQHDGLLPSAQGGAVPGMPSETWAKLNMMVRTGGRGLTRKGVSGLGHLFRLYGLKFGYAQDNLRLREAWEHYCTTGQTGLVCGEDDRGLLTEEMILATALRYAADHDWALPTCLSGAIEGRPNDSWRKWDRAISTALRGLTREGLHGLADLFRVCGIKNGKRADIAAVQRAWARYEETGETGLVVDTNAETGLTEDFILMKALAYAADHDGRLPRQRPESVEGAGGQTWSGWDASLRRAGRGLEHRYQRGLIDLYVAYGLMTDRQENAAAVRRAVANVKETGAHGLTRTTPSRPAAVISGEAARPALR
jgi:hypothetical protein